MHMHMRTRIYTCIWPFNQSFLTLKFFLSLHSFPVYHPSLPQSSQRASLAADLHALFLEAAARLCGGAGGGADDQARAAGAEIKVVYLRWCMTHGGMSVFYLSLCWRS